MRYEARITAYDVMGQVHIGGALFSQDSLSPVTATPVLHFATDVAGVGEPDPAEWLRDALVALLESL